MIWSGLVFVCLFFQRLENVLLLSLSVCREAALVESVHTVSSEVHCQVFIEMSLKNITL